MPIANFTINRALEKQINTIISEKGFQSKAEFFRLAAISYLNSLDRQTTINDDKVFDYLTSRLTSVAHKKLGGQKLPSLHSQLNAI